MTLSSVKENKINKRRQRTEEYEADVKTAIMDNMVAEEIQEMLFDKLIRQGMIVVA